jgi:hypothetical protein
MTTEAKSAALLFCAICSCPLPIATSDDAQPVHRCARCEELASRRVLRWRIDAMRRERAR